jgi:hypothetical protein
MKEKTPISQDSAKNMNTRYENMIKPSYLLTNNSILDEK